MAAGREHRIDLKKDEEAFKQMKSLRTHLFGIDGNYTPEELALRMRHNSYLLDTFLAVLKSYENRQELILPNIIGNFSEAQKSSGRPVYSIEEMKEKRAEFDSKFNSAIGDLNARLVAEKAAEDARKEATKERIVSVLEAGETPLGKDDIALDTVHIEFFKSFYGQIREIHRAADLNGAAKLNGEISINIAGIEPKKYGILFEFLKNARDNMGLCPSTDKKGKPILGVDGEELSENVMNFKRDVGCKNITIELKGVDKKSFAIDYSVVSEINEKLLQQKQITRSR